MRSSLISPLLCLALYFPLVLSFSATVGLPPNECGSLYVSWTGGQPPFQILMVPVYNIPRNITVPSSAFNNNRGSYQISPIPFVHGTQFLVAMSDATGFGTGGASELLTVKAPVGSSACNTSNPSLLFSFSLPDSLQQCSPYEFNGYDGAALPNTIAGFIPGGNIFLLRTPSTGTSFTWVADVAAGTRIIFSMTDANGNSGGSSDIETVALSNDASCLNKNSPSSTISSTPSTTLVASSTTSPTQVSSSSGASPGTIAGTAIGAVLAVAATVALAVCCLKRKRYGRLPYGLAPTRNSRRPNSVELDPGVDNFQHPPIQPFPYQIDSASRLAPPAVLSSPSYPGTPSSSPSIYASEVPYTQRHSRTNSNTDSYAALGDVASSAMSSSGRRKAAMAGMSSYQPSTRFIVHTDAEDYVPEGEPEVVELPPQYSERHPPAAMHPGVSSASRLSASDLAYMSEQYVDEPRQSTPHSPPQ